MSDTKSDQERREMLADKLDQAMQRMREAPSFNRISHITPVLDISRRLLLLPGGCEALEERALAFESIGIFEGTDWANPSILVPAIAKNSLASPDAGTLMLEVLNSFRMLAVALGQDPHPLISSEEAHHHLTQVIVLNLDRLFSSPGEAERVKQGRLAQIPHRVLHYLADRIGYEDLMDQLIDEIWRILRQRPIKVDNVKHMITQIAVCRSRPDVKLGNSGKGADRIISSLYGTTQACWEDPGTKVYQERLLAMDRQGLQSESIGFARAMHDTGLVSPYLTVLLQHILLTDDSLICDALGLSATGRESYLCYKELVLALMERIAYPETAQAVYGIALLLERGILHLPSLAPALWRQLQLQVSLSTRAQLEAVYGTSVSPETRLLEGVLCILGLPLGVGQGNHPTCQSARALSMWAYNDPDYLLQMVVWAARDDEIRMHFEGKTISSRLAPEERKPDMLFDLDPVSLIVVPHLDRIYAKMMQRCSDREGDPHRWVNPEFHGWWSGRGFRINVEVATGAIVNLDHFLQTFYACYHPLFNGNQPLIHPQPAGIAVTDSAARFIGWHAITILRVALDPDNIMRVYFYNPNSDSGQDWGKGVVVNTAGKGERFGEASLPFEQFASRLYIFHLDPLESGQASLPDDELLRVKQGIMESWGAERTLKPDTITNAE